MSENYKSELDVSNEMDELALVILNILKNIMIERKYLDANLKEGYINMSKSRYLMRGQKISILQVNTTNLLATFKINSYLDIADDVKYFSYRSLDDTVLLKDPFAEEDTCVRLRSVKLNNQSEKEIEQTYIETKCETAAEDSGDPNSSTITNFNDPLKWFGVLVPESLRTCQSHFKQSLNTILKIASLQNKLKACSKKFKDLSLKKSVLISEK
ncbi:uncharacterized protein CDAR_314911 [Caerostris darwini]|uniref:Vacuolar ATPase assembly protein VMA22 n=1 Tax=Caerostris darwini TaxID=1538125 RepID=A0AAV4TWY1_9ARAC|nr:uncharacterized protein CDAR_314911 [Caerostris darwini]